LNPSLSPREVQNEVRKIMAACKQPEVDVNIFSGERIVLEAESDNDEYFDCIVENPNGEPGNLQAGKRGIFSFFWNSHPQTVQSAAPPMNIPKAQFQCKMQPMLRVKQGGIVRSVPTPTEDVTGATINTGGWQTVVGTFSAVALVEGCKGFLSVVLKRWFPLHHPEIDLWFQRLDSALNLAGIVSLGCTIAVGGWSALPIVAISGFTGFITSWIFRKFGIGENVAQFVFYLKDLIFYYVSQLLRLAGAPSGIAEMFGKKPPWLIK
jgi:hypothetical protein